MSSSFSNISIDIYEQILKFLSISDQTNYSLVNKNFYIIWKNFLNRKLKNKTINLTFENLDQFQQHPLIKRLDLQSSIRRKKLMNINFSFEGCIYQHMNEYYITGEYNVIGNSPRSTNHN